MDFPFEYSRSIDRDLVGRARGLRGLLTAEVGAAEAARRLTAPTITALGDAGLLRLTVPQRHGGHETGFATFLGVTAELARGCGSAAWVTTLINVCNWATGTFPDAVRKEVFGDGRGKVCGVLNPSGTARPTPGGYLVSGSWGFASGSLHADWALLGVERADGGLGNVLLPMDKVTIKDTWHVAGMRGTGSNTIIAENVLIPADHYLAITLEPQDPHPGEPLYRSALVPVIALVLAGPQLGLARAALDLTLAKISGRGIAYTFYEDASNAPSVQFSVAEAASLIDSAALHAFRAADDIDAAAAAGRHMTTTERLRVRMDTGQAVTFARRAIDLLLDVNGASSFGESNPLQRIWRDSSTAARHAVINPGISKEAYGRALLGVQDQMTPLV